MRDPRFDDWIGRFVVSKGLDQDLPAPIELPSKDLVWPVRGVERTPGILDLRAEERRCVLVFEAFDSIGLGPCEQKADHRVPETPVHEIVYDRAKLGFPAELFEQVHLRDEPDPMSGADQVALPRSGGVNTTGKS